MANKKSIFLESTSRTVAGCVSEVTEIIARIPGVVRTSQEYAPGNPGETAAILFTVELNSKALNFEVRPDPAAIRRQWNRFHKTSRHKPLSEKRALEIAWAQRCEWIRVQAALIESDQADVVSTFLPQLLQGDGRTLARFFIEEQLKALPAAEGAA